MSRQEISGRKAFGLLTPLAPRGDSRCRRQRIGECRWDRPVEKARAKSGRLTRNIFDGGFKRSFVAYCGGAHISARSCPRYTKVGSRSSPTLVVERTWSWLMNNDRYKLTTKEIPL